MNDESAHGTHVLFIYFLCCMNLFVCSTFYIQIPLDDNDWEELTEDQQNTATVLGLDPKSWNAS
jgi:hypothetical protein